MTAYFDTLNNEIHAARQGPEHAMADVLEAIERRLVFDVTVAAELPGFPVVLRDAVHRVVLRYGVVTLPDNAPRADFEHDDEYGQRLASMNDDLHTLFHAYALTYGVVCGDDPRNRMQEFATRGDERREAMVATETADRTRA